MIIKICDRCGDQIANEDISFVDGYGIIKTNEKVVDGTWSFLDLCDDCKESFRQWIRHDI